MGHYFPQCVPTPLVNKIVDSEPWKTPERGTIVFAPLTNIVNLIYITARFSPVYVVPVNSKSFVTYSLTSLIWKLFHAENLRKGVTKPLSEIIKTVNAPLVILAEGAPTNGSGLLKFVAFEAAVPFHTQIQVIGFTHDDQTEKFICGSWFRYVLGLFGRVYAPFSAVTTFAEDMPRCYGKLNREYLEKVRGVLGKLLHIPLLDLGADEYIAYIESYQKLGKGHLE
jgi:hypothetical protein